MRNLDQRLKRLEATHDGDDTREVVQAFRRADGTTYERHFTYTSTDLEADTQRIREQLAMKLERMVAIPVDPKHASIMQLLIQGDTAEVVERVDHWFERHSTDLPVYLHGLADDLRAIDPVCVSKGEET